MAGNDKDFLANQNHISLMQNICRHDQDVKMLWSKCAFFLLDYAKTNALVLLTDDKVVDPQSVWWGNLLIGAYEIAKNSGNWMVPIIAPLFDDTLPADIPQLHQVL